MRATLSSTRSRSLCTTTSGDVGGSYGSETPVKCSNLAGQRLAVEAFHVAFDEHLERRLDVDLDEATPPSSVSRRTSWLTAA